ASPAEQEARLKRLLENIVTVLERATGIDRAHIGGTYFMVSRDACHIPAPRRTGCLQRLRAIPLSWRLEGMMRGRLDATLNHALPDMLPRHMMPRRNPYWPPDPRWWYWHLGAQQAVRAIESRDPAALRLIRSLRQSKRTAISA
ncbi:MAG: hypothetical protein M3Z21_06135, partial [Pseudomonadota bacterium]|nr:hypothetical protein [Pseudomonadota bacterium]